MAGPIVFVLIGGAVFATAAIATLRTSSTFFRQLLERHPELQDAFPKPMLGTWYSPMLPSKMTYLTERRFENLAEIELRELGKRTLLSLNFYAVSFFLFMMSLLYWSI